MERPLSPEALRHLLDLRAAGSPGDWYVDKGLMGKNLWITTHLREEDFGNRGRDGSICSVSTEKVFIRPSYRGSRTNEIETRPIKKAGDDAKLIVAAVNALPALIAALLSDEQVDEAAWLIEWPGDRHGPVRYYSPGEPAVIGPNDALRFCRKSDAERFMHAEKLVGARAVEHLWMRDREAPSVTPPVEQPPIAHHGV